MKATTSTGLAVRRDFAVAASALCVLMGALAWILAVLPGPAGF